MTNEMIRALLSALSLWLFSASALGQEGVDNWYSTSVHEDIRIQNSLPKGGPYTGPAHRHDHHSYLVFYSRVSNETKQAFEFTVNFTADSMAIPNAPDTYIKLFLPPDTMTQDKQDLFSYGITELSSLEQATAFHRVLRPGEDVLFYVVAIFFQTNAGDWSEARGGNRAELSIEGDSLFYRMPPQIESLPCGRITFLD